MPVKVLFIGRYDIEMHNVRPEAEMIIGLSARGFDVGVMSNAEGWYTRRMAETGIRIHDFVPGAKFSMHAIRTIRQVLIDERYDVVHLFNNKAIVSGIFASLGLPVKVVTYRGQTGNISRRDPTCYLTHLSPRVDRIVCVAEAVRQSLIPEVSDPAKLVTIYKGHDLDWYRDVVAVDRASLDVPADAFLVGCVANNRPRKGVPVLIEAAHRLSRDANVSFMLAGGGMDDPSIRERIEGGTHADRFRILGYREDILPVVAACDATVLPAIKREGLPKTVIESMALSVPPVVTDTGGSPELVDSGSGIVVPPGDAQALADALDRLQADRDRARAMGAAARARIGSHFTLAQSIEAHASLYNRLCEA